MTPSARPLSPADTPVSSSTSRILPLGAALLMGSVSASALAQPVIDGGETILDTVEVTDTLVTPASKVDLRATRTQIGKGDQALRDIPQSVTVMTEKLISDRNLDDFREVLRTTAGVTFLAGETGEEDVRLRGFSLGTAGDIYRDGLRDGSLYERDTFNEDRVEVIKGSASMLFGKGSTGGVINQVSKQPFLMTQHEVSATVGSGDEKRIQGDFNWQTGDDAAFRLNVMKQEADNWGAEQDKWGVAPTFRWGIGTRNEFSVGLYHLDTKGRSSYSHPWFLSDPANRSGTIIPTLEAKSFYGLDSDKLNTQATYGTLQHTHRFDDGGELKSQLRHGRYERDLWASVIRLGETNGQPTTIENFGPDTTITRTPKGRVGRSDVTQFQSDYSNTFHWGGREHKLLAGIDLYHEDAKRNNNFPGAASGLTTTVGQPNNGDWRPDLRGEPVYNTFQSKNIGVYVQDTVALNDHWKAIAGLRLDHFKGSYNTAATATADAYSFDKSETLLSPRLGLLYQPNDLSSYYLSYGTSYNTSGDAYQFAPNPTSDANRKLANTPAEKSRNFEIGGKWDVLDQRLSLGAAAFYSEKYNERNQDPDSAAEQYLLSGKRHAMGMEFNAAGRLTPKWEVFWNHTWIPTAKIDKSNQVLAANGGGAQVEGDRPGLTPKHSGSLWTTYRVLPKLRLGAGANYRSSQHPDGSRAVKADSFVTWDAMAEYSFTDATALKLNVSNLTDELYADTLYRGFYGPGQPRRVQLTLKHQF